MQKYPGKGGWTYVVISEIPKDKHAHFGMVRVKGSIDNYEIKQYNLMPMSGDTLFLPIKAAIRKLINKNAGDFVHVVLYPDNSPVEIPGDLEICLRDEPSAYETFMSYSDSEKKAFIDWINAAKREETKISRITKMLLKLQKKQKLYDFEKK